MWRRAFIVLTAVLSLAALPKPTRLAEPIYLPDAAASRIVTVTETGVAAAGITVLTEAVAIKETGPRATVARFGEVYAFSPAFVAVHRDEPTEISFWNLQPDDDHDFMLVAPDSQVLMKVRPAGAAEDDLCLHLSRGGPLHLLLHDAPTGDDGADSRAGTEAWLSIHGKGD